MRAIDIGAIRARRAMLTDQIGHHRREISIRQQEIGNHKQAIVSLESKLADLDVAERVFAEIGGETSTAEDAPAPVSRSIDAPSPELLEAVTESKAADPGAQEEQEEDAPISAVAELGNPRERDVSPKIAKAAELWLRPSEEISAAEIGRVVGLSTRTLYNRLGPRDVARQSADPDEIDIAKTNEPTPSESRRTKPEGIPMMPEIIIEAITYALRDGRGGLKISELIAFVRERYWPEAPANSVGPVAWKMSKTGELQNNNSVYSLPYGDKSAHRERPSRNRKGIKRPRRKQSLGDRAVQESIRIIRERGQPVSTRDLCAVLAQRGIRFGGKMEAHRRLAHLLSTSRDLVGDRSRGNKTRGWSLKEWERSPDSPVEGDQPPSRPNPMTPAWQENEAAE